MKSIKQLKLDAEFEIIKNSCEVRKVIKYFIEPSIVTQLMIKKEATSVLISINDYTRLIKDVEFRQAVLDEINKVALANYLESKAAYGEDQYYIHVSWE